MLEQAILRQKVQDLLDKQKQAQALCVDLQSRTADATVKQQLDQLQRDQQRHMRLTERLLEILD